MLNTHTILRLLQKIRRLAFILSTTIVRKLTSFHWWHSLLVTFRALRGIDRTDSNPKPPSVSCADCTLGFDLYASVPSSSTTPRPQNVIGSNPEAPRDEVISFSRIPGVAKQTSEPSYETGEDVTAACGPPYSMMAEITDLVAITTKVEYERYERIKP